MPRDAVQEQGQGGIGSHASCSSFAQIECAWSIERPPEILLVVLSVIQAQKRDAALAIRGISSIRRLQGTQSSARHVTGVKITGIGKLMISVFMV